MSTFPPSSYREVQLGLEKRRSSVYFKVLTAHKKKNQINPPGVHMSQRLRGEYRPEQKSTTLFRDLSQTHVSSGLWHGLMIPARCVQ